MTLWPKVRRGMALKLGTKKRSTGWVLLFVMYSGWVIDYFFAQINGTNMLFAPRSSMACV